VFPYVPVTKEEKMNGVNYQLLTVALYTLLLSGFMILLVSLWGLIRSLFGNKKEIDPIVEAEIYITLGRKAQAIEVLNQALQETPNRVCFMNKLDELKGVPASVKPKSVLYTGRSPQTANLNYLMYINVSN
jgi:hypothetical protein